MFPCAAEIFFIGRLALVFAVAVAGSSPAPAAPNYFTRAWQVEQGLPQNKVNAVVQTRDGCLWAGTYNGLARHEREIHRPAARLNFPCTRSGKNLS